MCIMQTYPARQNGDFGRNFRLFSTHFLPMVPHPPFFRPHVYGLRLFLPIFRLFFALSAHFPPVLSCRVVKKANLSEARNMDNVTKRQNSGGGKNCTRCTVLQCCRHTHIRTQQTLQRKRDAVSDKTKAQSIVTLCLGCTHNQKFAVGDFPAELQRLES